MVVNIEQRGVGWALNTYSRLLRTTLHNFSLCSGDITIAEQELGTLARRLYSSDVRVAHAAVLYVLGDTAAAEDAWQAAC